MAWFLNIEDKVEVSGDIEKLYCPPHHIPHQIPFKKPIEKEPCHYHDSKWRMSHHIPYCLFLKCPNYARMREKCGNDKKKSAKSK